MRIVDQSIPIEDSSAFLATVVKPDGGFEATEYATQLEHVVRVYVNGVLVMNLTCSPDHIVELVVGRLFTENMIAGIDDIDELWLCEQSTRILVYLMDRETLPGGSAVVDVGTCCTDNRTLNSIFRREENLPILTPTPWTAEDVFALTRVFESDTPMHRRTYGAHSCYLAQGAEVLFCCEDLGRHNAFDKVVGSALLAGVDLTQCTVFTSGRVPTDMLTKAVRSRIPLVISKAVPTDLAVRMAQEHGLTLICSAHSDSFVVVNDPR